MLYEVKFKKFEWHNGRYVPSSNSYDYHIVETEEQDESKLDEAVVYELCNDLGLVKEQIKILTIARR